VSTYRAFQDEGTPEETGTISPAIGPEKKVTGDKRTLTSAEISIEEMEPAASGIHRTVVPVVPIVVTLPTIRPLRLLRLVTALYVLHQHSVGTKFRRRVISYTALSAALLVFVAALAELDTERNLPGASITSFGKVIWWRFTTITTVGDGSVTPVSITGRAIVAGLLIGGITLIGVISATFVSWIVERVAPKEKAEQAATRGQIADLAQRFARPEEIASSPTAGENPARSPTLRSFPSPRSLN